MPKRTSHADPVPTGVRVVFVTLDNHLNGVFAGIRERLREDLPGLQLSLHAAANWAGDPDSLARCREDIATADIVVATMLFMDEHIRPVLDALQSRRDHCDAMVGLIADPGIVHLTRLGPFDMRSGSSGPLALLRKLRGKRDNAKVSQGASQMAMLRRLPRLLRYVPGKAQDLRAYFLAMQYWLSGSPDNLEQMIRMLVDRYADGPRRALRGSITVREPVVYPDTGVYHPRLPGRLGDDAAALPIVGGRPRVGLLLMRSYLLAGNAAHYDAVIEALEARGLDVVPAFASGLDARPAIEAFFRDDQGRVTIDAMVSLTGFSLVGGPAYNDTAAAQQVLAELDVPYLSALPLEFQSLDQWRAAEHGLTPIETMMMVAIPELDGATGTTVFGGSVEHENRSGVRTMAADPERVSRLAERVRRMTALRATPRAERQLAIVLFCFPPNAGNVGSAAYLSVFRSLFNLLQRLAREGYDVEVPASERELREALLGDAAGDGRAARVHARVATDDHVRREPHLAEIEAEWGPAPGRIQTDGSAIEILGARFGRVFVGLQPGFGYEGDPMRLLFQRGLAPTHAFSAFYRWLREDFAADAILHFGTHGALEFMPGKQAGLSGACWPERLIDATPNFYLYAGNNPSEGLIAKRRSAATLLSHLTPPLAHAGLYRGLTELRESIDRYRLQCDDPAAGTELACLIQAQAAALDLAPAEPVWGAEDAPGRIDALSHAIRELEYTLIPDGLHVIGEPPDRARRESWLRAIAAARDLPGEVVDGVAALLDDVEAGRPVPDGEASELARLDRALRANDELAAIVAALDGGFVAPAPGGDLTRTPDILPTGRNIHGFDPFRMPTRYALQAGRTQAEQVLARMRSDSLSLPETIAMVLWGTDNLKTEGMAVAQALALIGARPVFDHYGRLSGAELVPLDELGRPRIDVVMTLSGIFRDLLPQQCRLLAQAALLAASADEPPERNYVRKHALACQAANGVSLEVAALRVFSNAPGAYGSNVNQLIESSRWDDEDELGNAYKTRKCHAYGADGSVSPQIDQLERLMGCVQATYQNLDSVELGVTTIDHYFDTLGGISRAASSAQGRSVPVYIADHTTGGRGQVRSLDEQVALETRTRMLNPRWHESMLEHGYEGVHCIETHLTNTMGWSATTGQVDPWVYRHITQTFVLDDAMRARLAELNPSAGLAVANRLIEACERNYWQADPEMLDALHRASEELEDRLEGVCNGAIA